MEAESVVRAQFQRGLRANAARAAKFIRWFRKYDNDNTLAFDVNGWRTLNDLWTPQTEISEAHALARRQISAWLRKAPRRYPESMYMRDPLFAAWIVVLSGDADLIAAARHDIQGALTHFRWERLHTSCFFMAECVYWQLRQQA